MTVTKETAGRVNLLAHVTREKFMTKLEHRLASKQEKAILNLCDSLAYKSLAVLSPKGAVRYHREGKASHRRAMKWFKEDRLC